MSLLDDFTRQWTSTLSGGPALLPSTLARACAGVLGVDGAGISVMSGSGIRLPLGASDDSAALAERLQFTIGEGPCFQAQQSGRPVHADAAAMSARWPALAQEHLQRTPFRFVLSLPLLRSQSSIGALDLYRRAPGAQASGVQEPAVDAEQLTAAAAPIAASITSILLGTAPQEVPVQVQVSGASWLDTPAVLSREQVWIAIGMVNVVLRLDADDALALLRAHAYAGGQTLDEVVDAVVSQRIDPASLGTGAAPEPGAQG
ncbi:GAF domain-containing protein [Kineococcus sp. T13]|uniref:GAF domain-containing protein n=1 Tax=Kineococcus vitellinus TaxID=2696565 RepID=UPI001412F350|nr:GAF domain-containing protein [Kineococcus vitellinus]NAZ74343.1 GAF domain-containing protein [Kineococcus vitellinus]